MERDRAPSRKPISPSRPPAVVAPTPGGVGSNVPKQSRLRRAMVLFRYKYADRLGLVLTIALIVFVLVFRFTCRAMLRDG